MKINDKVKHPEHYTKCPAEVIDIIKASVEDFGSYCHGNVIKYILRALHKGGIEDIKKAREYMDWLIEYLEEEAEKRGQTASTDPNNALLEEIING